MGERQVELEFCFYFLKKKKKALYFLYKAFSQLMDSWNLFEWSKEAEH